MSAHRERARREVVEERLDSQLAIPPRRIAVHVNIPQQLPALGRAVPKVVSVLEARRIVRLATETRVIARIALLLLRLGVPSAFCDVELRKGVLARPSVELASRAVLEAGLGLSRVARGRSGRGACQGKGERSELRVERFKEGRVGS